jgi:hypothetical protein
MSGDFYSVAEEKVKLLEPQRNSISQRHRQTTIESNLHFNSKQWSEIKGME